MKHAFLFESEDTQSVLWRCSNCKQAVVFAKPGFGGPTATSTVINPDAGKYIDPCLPDPDPVQYSAEQDIGLIAKVILKAIDINALIADGTLTQAQKDKLVAMRQKLKS